MIYNDEQKTDAEVLDTVPELVGHEAHSRKTEAEFVEKFMQEHLKKVTVGVIDAAQRLKLQNALNLLTTLKEEVVAKKFEALEKKDFIKNKVALLKQSGKVNIDEEEFDKTEVSVAEFVTLLDKMIDEIERDIVFYQGLLSDAPPTHVFAYKDEPDDFGQQLEHRLASIKKYAKNAKRDLTVSFSRYCFGFDAQIRQISYVEYVLNHVKKNSKDA